jgi:hypothetical protein
LAIPTDGRSINNILATTLDAKLPRLTENFFGTNAFVQRLLQRASAGETTVKYRGGAEIRSAIIYNGLPSHSYGKGDTFGTTFTEFATDLQFQWKRIVTELNVDHMDVRKNMGSAAQIIDFVEVLAKNGVMSLKDELGSELFSDGTGNNSKNWDGLLNAIADSTTSYTTYGGITRGTTTGDPGNAINAYFNSTATTFSLSDVNTAYGKVRFDDAKVDLIVTTQTLWNKFWERVQPADRNAPGPLREVGFETIRFNGAEVVVDSHCASGSIFGLNTAFIELWLMEGMDFVRRGAQFGPNGFPVYNQDTFVDQLIAYGNFIVPGPRYCFQLQNRS